MWNKTKTAKPETGTKHSYQCSRVFKNYDMNCTRCVELANGSKPRDGWQKAYYENKARQEAIQIAAIRAHNCKERNCGIVCTFGEW